MGHVPEDINVQKYISIHARAHARTYKDKHTRTRILMNHMRYRILLMHIEYGN